MSWARANCTFIRPRTPMPCGQLERGLAHPLELAGAEGDRRQRARGVAGVDAGLLDVLHDAAEVHLGAVVEHVDVDLDGVVEEAVDEHRVLGRGDGRPLDVAAAGSRRRRRSPCRARRARTTAARAPGSRSPWRSRPPRPRCRPCRAWAPAGSASCSTRPNAPRSSARSIASGDVPTIGTPSALSALARPSGVCPPSCTMTPAIGPAWLSACTTSSTSSRVSGSK